jgi:uncharacterized protein (DUF1800 family)
MPLTSDRDRIAHLLRRAGLGASPADLATYIPFGPAGAVDALLDYDAVDEGLDVDFWALQDERVKIPAKLAGAWWTYRMLVTRRPAQEKLVLFWHNHFGCSLEKVKASMLMYQHLNTLRSNATGNFRTLLIAIAQDPTMLVFLDGKDNVSGNPNENFARELLELYTLGEGHYTEQDIQEAARAFTGWSIQRNGKIIEATGDEMLPSYRFRPGQHDTGVKTVLGVTGNLDGTDVIDILLKQPQHARFLCKKLWEWYAYPNPEETVLRLLTSTYISSGYEIKPVLKAIFTSDEFYSAKGARVLYKSPVDFAISIMRQLNAPALIALARQSGQNQGGEAGARLRLISTLAGYTYKAMESMGMQLMFPPSVAGWDTGAAWVNSATMLQRIKFADLFDPEAPQRRNVKWQFVVGDRQFGTLAEAVDFCCGIFDAPLTPEQRQTIAASAQAAADKKLIPNESRQAALHEICRLVFSAPEFQFC